MKIGLVSYKKQPLLTEIDRKLIPIFQDEGIEAIPVVWNDPLIPWSKFDYLILRSVWDYHLDSFAFLKWLNHLDQNKVALLNPTSIIRQNHHKFYLKTLHDKGIQIVPTLFVKQSENFKLENLKEKKWKKAVIKPAISASSFLTEVFDLHDVDKVENKYRPHAKDRDFLIQEFMPEVQTYGELSILFFNRKYSHTVLKTAKPNEFRVQEEFGGISKLHEPPSSIIEQAGEVLSKFEGDILQARIDGIIRNGQLILMEIELIEPHLFFEYNAESASMFVKEATDIMSGKNS